MARLTKRSESPSARFSEDLYGASPRQTPEASANVTAGHSSLSPSPTASISSDKENRSQHATIDKGKGRASMLPPRAPVRIIDGDKSGKRKRLHDHDNVEPRERRRRTVELEASFEDDEDEESDSYDPDQSIEERRQLRKSIRDLGKDLNENRAEYMLPDSTGLLETLNRANEITSSIKQTSDATLDSRLLVSTADLSYRRVQQLTLGGNAIQGVDIDDLVSKAIAFMRQGDGPRMESGTQRRRQRLDDDDDNDGDMLNWEYLGHNICLQHNSRPSVPGFLLGPLSLEKRARKPLLRKANLKHSNVKETRPEVLQLADIEKTENTTLTVLCTRILTRLSKVQRDGQQAVEDEHREGMTDAEVKALMDKHGVHESGGVDFFKFVINPSSFGQTIENLFYVSFLIRDGKAGVIIGDDGLPSLYCPEPRPRDGPVAKGVSKHQAVLAMDMETWQKAIENFNITESMIPHRVEEPQTQVGARGWYT